MPQRSGSRIPAAAAGLDPTTPHDMIGAAMGATIKERLKEIARRAGIEEVSPGVLLGVIGLAVLAVAWAAWRWWPGTAADDTLVLPNNASVSAAGKDGAAGAEGEDASGAGASKEVSVTVHVVGAVRHPGVYLLPTGSRVVDAVEMAGGVLGNAVVAAVNMARPLADGEQVFIPDEDTQANGAGQVASLGSGGVGVAATGGLVDLNSADTTLLETLPGVGPSTAKKIVMDRETNGPFSSVDDLGRVSGIGPKKLEQLRELVCAN